MEDTATHFSDLQSSLSEVEVSMMRNICCTWSFRESLLREKAVAADQVDLAQVTDREKALI